jgi:4-hydroxy-tetrahydrodipicolinate synthase
VRRAYRIAELAPELDLLVGADDVLLELALAGAKGWIAGYPNMVPAASVELYRAAVSGDLATATALYRQLHPLLRWDSRPEFVQAIKLSMDIIGRHGGPCRPPRMPLLPDQEKAVRAATEQAVAAGLV